MIDHSLLRADATNEDLIKLCQEARDKDFKMVAVNSIAVKLCVEILKNSSVHVGAAVGFPLGQTTIAVKVFETAEAIKEGADEIDYVVNLTEVKAGNWSYITEEMRSIVDLCKASDIIVKVILENCYLTKEEMIKLCEIAREVKPDFVKTSTGFGPGGAKAEDVRLMKETVGDVCEVKAAGQIRDWPTCREMIAAGATRIGTSSSLAILTGYDKENSR